LTIKTPKKMALKHDSRYGFPEKQLELTDYFLIQDRDFVIHRVNVGDVADAFGLNFATPTPTSSLPPTTTPAPTPTPTT
jgi:hypothetical protein